MRIGLRIDVDTFRGTRFGVPSLCRLLADRGMQATFFFSVGPDNMGRHLWRLANPSFMWKMLRSNAPGLYGWDIVLRGTLWPGPVIGERLAPIIRHTKDEGHEIGFHAWDHHSWQAKIDSWDRDRISDQYYRGVTMLADILGQAPACSAAPSWMCNDIALQVEATFPFRFNSDCRGETIFVPQVRAGVTKEQPQIPVTLPTYDEVVGRDGVTGSDYYTMLPSLLSPSKLNVLTIHAEVEGMSRLEDFGRFMTLAAERGWSFVPLGNLIDTASVTPPGRIVKGTFPGRSGWVACQEREPACSQD